ncbi:MAG: nuclear transport factor 2 family protein, partial [Hyphomicrobiales bacterium]|nr:nuclear transport factor 2 family protein [Hyphomicrobiales bacterium]
MLKLAIITSLLAFGAPAFAQDSAHIQMLNDQFAAAFNKGDAAAIGAMYTEEAVVLPAGSPLVRGREAIQNFWKKG